MLAYKEYNDKATREGLCISPTDKLMVELEMAIKSRKRGLMTRKEYNSERRRIECLLFDDGVFHQ